MEYSHKMPARNQISNEILSMGVELECATTPKRVRLTRRFFQRYGMADHLEEKRDGSVYVRSPVPHSIPNAEITFWGPKKIDIKHFFEKMDLGGKTKTNSTCGTHMHFRFPDMGKALAIFTSHQAWREFRAAYVDFARGRPKYLDRLNNRFSKFPENRPPINMQDHYDRYYGINVMSMFEHQRTLEIRIMPGFDDVDEAMEAVNFEVKAISKIYKKYANVTFLRNENGDGAFHPVLSGRRRYTRNNNVYNRV
jgi:hypothetical protein